MNYYNEFDPGAAQWLRNLIAAGHIPRGEVDERSIEDVRPTDLHGFTQCHFFAGIGGWPLALKLAGWPDDRPIWTGSCPCQPFSTAGAGLGFADERHLWPAFHWLIEQCRPAVVVGEQVASAAVNPWLDLVSTDLEDLGYAFGAYAGPSAGVGAPHIRDRCYWGGVADADHAGLEGWRESERRRAAERAAGPGGLAGGVADGDGERRYGVNAPVRAGQVSDAQTGGCSEDGIRCTGGVRRVPQVPGRAAGSPASPLHGFWSDADWLGCRDGKWRPAEPGSFPLAHGVSNRVVRLRAYGNAINPHQAAEFLKPLMEYLRCSPKPAPSSPD